MEQVFKCDLCSDEFDSLDKLNAHTEREHEGVQISKRKSFGCNLCRYKCSSRWELTRHTRSHTGERPFKCKVADCGMAFIRESNLNEHFKYKHSDKRPFKCEFPGCLHTTKTSTSLNLHKKAHSDERPYTCPKDGCSFQCKWKSDITRHVKCVHNKAKTFACTKCDYKTAQSGSLKSHMRRHSARKDFKCNHPPCKASFKLSSHLKRHLSKLHGENNIQCDRPGCRHSASTKKALEDHLKLHDPSRWPFQCPLCLKHFKTLRQMQDHCFVHTNEKPFKCGQCNYAAATRGCVKTHISSAHANILFPFIVHLLEDRECLHCKVTLPSTEFLIHSESHHQGGSNRNDLKN